MTRCEATEPADHPSEINELNDEQVAAICRVLIEHDVQFVIIGGTEHGPLDLCFTPDGFPDGFSTPGKHATVVGRASSDDPS